VPPTAIIGAQKLTSGLRQQFVSACRATPVRQTQEPDRSTGSAPQVLVKRSGPALGPGARLSYKQGASYEVATRLL
jgi:hypothetical protein